MAEDGAAPRILVSGATGFIGRALVPHLAAAGATVHRVVRGPAGEGEASWGLGGGPLDVSRLPGGSLEGLDAVVHLAGAPIASRRWSDKVRREIIDSRVRTTAVLSTALSRCERPPPVLVSASAVGWYGDRGDVLLAEVSEPGRGFLATLCRDWEGATAPAAEAGIRVSLLRTGIVLGPGGGTLEPLLHLFRAGVGGPVGSGQQWVSWISLEDELRAIDHVLATPMLAGPVNLVAPEPVTNATLAKSLGKALHRPAVAKVPAAALRLVLGRELAGQLLLASQRALPVRLQATGFAFTYPDLAGALEAALGSRHEGPAPAP